MACNYMNNTCIGSSIQVLASYRHHVYYFFQFLKEKIDDKLVRSNGLFEINTPYTNNWSAFYNFAEEFFRMNQDFTEKRGQ